LYGDQPKGERLCVMMAVVGPYNHHFVLHHYGDNMMLMADATRRTDKWDLKSQLLFVSGNRAVM
jgi:hypothetical protein